MRRLLLSVVEVPAVLRVGGTVVMRRLVDTVVEVTCKLIVVVGEDWEGDGVGAGGSSSSFFLLMPVQKMEV